MKDDENNIRDRLLAGWVFHVDYDALLSWICFFFMEEFVFCLWCYCHCSFHDMFCPTNDATVVVVVDNTVTQMIVSLFHYDSDCS
jgi:hypothetical protein